MLALLVGLGIAWRTGRLPIEEARRLARSGWDRIVTAVEEPESAIALVMTPENTAPPLAQAPSPEPTANATMPPTAQASETPAPTATEPAPTETPLVADTPTPLTTATATAEPVYVVVRGDSLMIIGDKVGLPWQDIARANGLTGSSMLSVGQQLRLPAATPAQIAMVTATEPPVSPTSPPPTATAAPVPVASPTSGAVAAAVTTATSRPSPAAAPSATSSATSVPPPLPAATATAAPTAARPQGLAAQPDGISYTLRSGDTLLVLGQRFGVAWETIAAVNNITDATALRVGTTIIIPAPGGSAPPTSAPPTVAPTRPATSTPAQPAVAPLPGLPAVAPLSPADGAQYSGNDSELQLAWDPGNGLPDGAVYRVTVRWTAAGVAQYHWWLAPGPQTVVPDWLWQKADQPERRYTWSVEVVQSTPSSTGQQVVPLSEPGPSRYFYWN